MIGSMFVIIWEFEVRSESSEVFERQYGAAGAWAVMFQSAPGFISTELIRDTQSPHRYLTIDRWRSEADHNAFKEAHRDEYCTLDAACEAFTVSEARVGHFSTLLPRQ